jgi:hypothetical protein
MRDLSLHILDIAENSINAGAASVELLIRSSKKDDSLEVVILDDGSGIDLEAKESDAYFTSKEGKCFGLGIPLLAQSCKEGGGEFFIGPRDVGGKEDVGGTQVRATFSLSHIDLKPMGDVGATVAMLVCAHPAMDYLVRVRGDDEVFELDTKELRKELEGLPLENPAVMKYIKENINEAIRRIHG